MHKLTRFPVHRTRVVGLAFLNRVARYCCYRLTNFSLGGGISVEPSERRAVRARRRTPSLTDYSTRLEGVKDGGPSRMRSEGMWEVTAVSEARGTLAGGLRLVGGPVLRIGPGRLRLFGVLF